MAETMDAPAAALARCAREGALGVSSILESIWRMLLISHGSWEIVGGKRTNF
jgi:hypothetical protein